VIDQQSVERAAERFQLPEGSFDRLELRRDRKRRNQRIRAGVLGIAIAIVVGWWGLHTISSSAPKPADPSEKFGIFAPVAGRILFVNGNDVGYGQGVWAVDPDGPSDSIEGPSVADDLASTLVPLNLEQGAPPGFSEIDVFGWSSEGTELLFARIQPYSSENPFPDGYLYILHADGSETRLNNDPMSFAEFPAAISPDGKHVAYATDGVQVVDVRGGRPIRIAEEGEAPTFSPDGTQVAYFVGRQDENQVWVANVDGSDAHEILAHDATTLGAPTGMQWSPAGDLIALGAGASKGSDALAVYTFAPDGSNFTRVMTGGQSPYWSPDGTQIAFTVPCGPNPTGTCPEGSILRSQYDDDPELFGGGSPGLAVADANGSNVTEYGFAVSGPWHPGASMDEPTSTPDENFARADGEVLSFAGVASAAAQPYDKTGQLGAVDPETGEERMLVPNLDGVVSAEWSADGRWVTYVRNSGRGVRDHELWIAGASQQPRLIDDLTYISWAGGGYGEAQ
jgi:Tol biopolymer transport system component